MSTFNFMLQATLMFMLQQQFLIKLQNIKNNSEDGKCMTLKSFCFLHVFDILEKQCHMFIFLFQKLRKTKLCHNILTFQNFSKHQTIIGFFKKNSF